MHNEDPMTPGLDAPATKADLAATTATLREETAALGTALRQEMSAMGRDLRVEMSAMGQDLRGEIARVETSLSATCRNLAIEILRSREETQAMGIRLESLITATRSDVLRACEVAVFKAEKVDRDQLLTRDRLDQHEIRIKAIEARLPPHR